MPAMTKRVNVRTTVPVRTIIPPLSGSKKNTIMSCSDILKCLCRRAIVDEILPDGRTVRLTMDNYCKDNGAGLDAYHPKKVVVQTKELTPDPQPVVAQEESKVNANIVMKSDLENDAKNDNDKKPEENPIDQDSVVEDDDTHPDDKVEKLPDDTNNGDEHHKNNKKNRH